MTPSSESFYEPIDLPDRMDFGDEKMLEEAKAFLNRMKRRHSVRDFSGRAVAREVIEECVRAAGTAGLLRKPLAFGAEA